MSAQQPIFPADRPQPPDNPARRKQVRRIFLEALRHASPYALPVEVLQAHCNDLLRPPMNLAEWGITSAFLCKNGFIVSITSDIDPDLKQWAITDLGKTLLATL